MKFIGALGLDIKLLLANILNFVILVYLLKKIAYKPILEFIQQRTKTIEEGVKNAELAKKNLSEATAKQEEILTGAHKQAQGIITTAKQQAEQHVAQLLQEGREESTKLIQSAHVAIEHERKEALKAAEHEVANLVVLATEKILQQKVDQPTDKAYIERVLTELKA
jgi:F-type H+-transporting ATPase subunit b